MNVTRTGHRSPVPGTKVHEDVALSDTSDRTCASPRPARYTDEPGGTGGPRDTQPAGPSPLNPTIYPLTPTPIAHAPAHAHARSWSFRLGGRSWALHRTIPRQLVEDIVSCGRSRHFVHPDVWHPQWQDLSVAFIRAVVVDADDLAELVAGRPDLREELEAVAIPQISTLYTPETYTEEAP